MIIPYSSSFHFLPVDFLLKSYFLHHPCTVVSLLMRLAWLIIALQLSSTSTWFFHENVVLYIISEMMISKQMAAQCEACLVLSLAVIYALRCHLLILVFLFQSGL
ncbi:hypothetical protein KP509_17G069600 [Ceratopteris richardii]|uniref:Uncharacterized protein n=1 Tax=Ceratopteris richardii TaxID=49495 RepID=A0A8T2SVZ1_CERRI|nr:hypothetical protein KP509_17G069600 [Ceratopteris richardii]